jgi:hypothetical protein
MFLFLLYINRSFGQTVQSLQISPELQANSDRWGIGSNGKSFDIRLAVFGPFSVTGLQKLDSGASKNKVKEEKGGSYAPGDGYDEYKVRRLEMNTIFHMTLAGESDSTESLFSAFTAKRKKTETVLGMMLSKNTSSGGSEILSERKQAEGIIHIKNDTTRWNFFVDYPGSSSNARYVDHGLNGYLTNGVDSITMKVLYSVVSTKSKDSTSPDKIKTMFARGVSLIDMQGVQIAALIFKPALGYAAKKSDNYTNEELVMINKGIDKSARLAIASLYAIMIGIQGY